MRDFEAILAPISATLLVCATIQIKEHFYRLHLELLSLRMKTKSFLTPQEHTPGEIK
jgi:hypothetical protein